MIVWDPEAAAPRARLEGAHAGHVTAMAWMPDGGAGAGETLLLTGGQDGTLRVWDCRAARACVGEVAAHVGAGGRGAVSEVLALDGGGVFVTAGADRKICSWRLDGGGLARLGDAALPDFPYALVGCGRLAAVGLGDGSVRVYDARGPGGGDWEALWTLAGANGAAVRGLALDAGRMFVTGDDGGAALYSWPNSDGGGGGK